MGAPRAFRILCDNVQCGLLGEGPGPFVTATRSALPAPQMPVLRFTSLNPQQELRVTEFLLGASDIDAVIAEMTEAGYQFEVLPFAEAFGLGATS